MTVEEDEVLVPEIVKPTLPKIEVEVDQENGTVIVALDGHPVAAIDIGMEPDHSSRATSPLRPSVGMRGISVQKKDDLGFTREVYSVGFHHCGTTYIEAEDGE